MNFDVGIKLYPEEELDFQILINGLPHIALNTTNLIGFQAFIDEHAKVKYGIEFYYPTTTILAEYDTEAKWTKILNEINKHL